jgi:hypothetical protein
VGVEPSRVEVRSIEYYYFRPAGFIFTPLGNSAGLIL